MWGNRFILVTTPSHVSIPPNQKGTLAKDGFSESGKCIGNLQPCECCRVVACVFSRGARLCVCMRDECSGASYWPVGCDSVTGQGAFEYAGTMRDEQAVDVLAGAVDCTREGCGLFAWLLKV